MNRRRIKEFYIGQLQDNFLPYWSAYVDEQYGGIMNCINNYGDQLLSDDKFTWSQGRWLWVLGSIYILKKEQGIFEDISRETLEKWMKGAWDFITTYSIYDDDRCCYRLTRDGKKKMDEKLGRYDTSIYADCFALIGMSRYIAALEYREGYEKAEALWKSIVRRMEADDFLTEPFTVPGGYRNHAKPMILLVSVHEFIRMKKVLNMDVEEDIAYGRKQAESTLNEFHDGKGHIIESKSTPERAKTHLLDRYINPGHGLEDIWFCIEFLEEFGGLDEYLPEISFIVKTTFNEAWDKEYGGLLRYIDVEGGPPKGVRLGSELEDSIAETWDMKLWWPHSELLYLFVKMYSLTGDEDFVRYYEKSFTYAFTTFPNQKLGEWVQIRKRDGSPEDKVVALPVKDPFHIMRNFIKIVEVCS